jgi:pimeloyl-ACP methyl ester carboxylesterase
VRCATVNTPVHIQQGGDKNYNINGVLCVPPHPRANMVQVLLSGGSYNHKYWDPPYQPQKYSYVRYMASQGYATFNMERMGNGLSSHPLSVQITRDTDALVTHQIVQKLRSDEVGNRRFSKVSLVGNSQGSLIAMLESARFRDVDGVVITGMLHKPYLLRAADYNIFAWPALLDPNMSDRDPGYVTTRPGPTDGPVALSRGGPMFYNRSDVDPAMAGIDEKYLKDAVTVPELAAYASLLDGTSTAIHARVFVVNGTNDNVFCGRLASNCSSRQALMKQEKPFYPNAQSLTTAVLPHAGHLINLHLNARQWFKQASSWFSTF